ncbi:MAG TPA: hypothetical protein VKK79_01790, partial [Candidatus Lokiarchaeia archaeon]|nr:hypothetical protein [Candidatus Lokiarchaeia archaeon]
MEEALLAARFPFLRDDVFLVAEVNKTTGRQVLRMQQVDPNTQEVLHEDALDCIHAAVCDIPVQEFAETIQEEDFAENILRIRSSEQLQEINLAPEEKFVALRSWVAGIAEAGMDAFAIQGEIDVAANLQFPVTSRLLRFLSTVDPAFLPTYLDYVDRTSQHEGVRERSYLIASLLPVLENLTRDAPDLNRTQAFQIIFAMEPPLEIFSGNWPLFRKLTQADSIFLSFYLARVQQIYSEKRGGGEEWLMQVLPPVLDSLVWVTDRDSTETQRAELWQQILALDPPPELFSGFGTLFRYFAFRDPSFLSQ